MFDNQQEARSMARVMSNTYNDPKNGLEVKPQSEDEYWIYRSLAKGSGKTEKERIGMLWVEKPFDKRSSR